MRVGGNILLFEGGIGGSIVSFVHVHVRRGWVFGVNTAALGLLWVVYSAQGN